MTPALTLAIENVYRAFADVPRPRDIDMSPLKDPAIAQKILAVPLRDVPADDMGTYAGSATLTVGDENDYRYFLPRILECSVISGGYIGFEPVIIADRLMRANWESWSSREQASVRAFFGAAFEASLETWVHIAPHDILVGLCELGAPVSPALELWRQTMHGEAIRQLASFVEDNATSILGDRPKDPWSTLPEAERHEVGRWLVSTETLDQLLAAAAEATPAQISEVEYAAGILETCLTPLAAG